MLQHIQQLYPKKRTNTPSLGVLVLKHYYFFSCPLGPGLYS